MTRGTTPFHAGTLHLLFYFSWLLDYSFYMQFLFDHRTMTDIFDNESASSKQKGFKRATEGKN